MQKKHIIQKVCLGINIRLCQTIQRNAEVGWIIHTGRSGMKWAEMIQDGPGQKWLGQTGWVMLVTG